MHSKFNLNYFILLWSFSSQSRQFFNTGFVHSTVVKPKTGTIPDHQFHSIPIDVPNDKIDDFKKVLQQHPDKIREYGLSLLANQKGSKKELNNEDDYLSRATQLLPSYLPTRIRLLNYPTADYPTIYDINGQNSVLTTRGMILWRKCMNGIKKAVKSIYNFSPLEYLNRKLGIEKGVSIDNLNFIINKARILKNINTLDDEKEINRKNSKLNKSIKIKDKTKNIGSKKENQHDNIGYTIPIKIKNSNNNHEKIPKENMSTIYNKSNINSKNNSENNDIKEKSENERSDYKNDNNSSNNSSEESAEGNVSKKNNVDKKFNTNNVDDKNLKKNGNKNDKSDGENDKHKYKNISDDNGSENDSWEKSDEKSVKKSIDNDKKEIKEEKGNNKGQDSKESSEEINNEKSHGQFRKNNSKNDLKIKSEEIDSNDGSTEKIKDNDSLGDNSPEIGMKISDKNNTQNSKKNTLNLPRDENSKAGSGSGNEGSFSDNEDFDSADIDDDK